MEPESTAATAVDEEGFLKAVSGWTREVAADLARANSIGPLTDEHWAVIEFVKDYYAERGMGPPVVRIGKATGLSIERICGLFPCGVVKGVYRLAGLPKPPGCT